MNRKRHFSPKKQNGLTFWHVMVLVVAAVLLALCAKSNSIPYFQKPLPNIGRFNMPNFPDQRRSDANYYRASDARIQSDDSNTEWLMVNDSEGNTGYETGYETRYPRDLVNGFYTVQVFSGYNSKSAYELEKALKRDGYRAYVYQERDQRGVLFKVRIGEYKNRSDAFAMRSKIRLSYPQQLSKSFVLLRQ